MKAQYMCLELGGKGKKMEVILKLVVLKKKMEVILKLVVLKMKLIKKYM
jgi:hypothetical protein